jgi:tryptophan halogenase
MLGQRVIPSSYHPAAQLVPEAQLTDSLSSLSSSIARAVDGMPTHEARLRSFAAQDRSA